METSREIISKIKVNKPNLDYISKTGKINGSLLSDIENAMNVYNSHQIEKLEADKAELLEALEESNLQIEYLHEKFNETGSGKAVFLKNKSLIQKMKQ